MNTKKHIMKLHNYWQCFEDAIRIMQQGADIYQQFNCSACGTKQTMDVPNTFYIRGQCEECNYITNILKDGMNYLVHYNSETTKDERLPTLSVGGGTLADRLEVGEKARAIMIRLATENSNAKPS